MKILLIERGGTDLYSTLYDSDTSRAMLRFYHPVRHPAGVEIRTASLGSALSLTSELRWYIQRYVDEVLFTEDGTVYLTWSLADELYRRGATLSRPWPHRFRYRIHGGKVSRSPWDLAAFGGPSPEPSRKGSAPAGTEDRDTVLEVWSTAEEYAEPDRGEPGGPVEPGSLVEGGEPGEDPPADPGESGETGPPRSP